MDTRKLELLCEAIRFQKSVIASFQGAGITSPAKLRKVQMAFDRFNKKVITSLQDELNVEMIEFAYGTVYEEGLPVEAINIEDFSDGDKLVIVNTIEPVIKEKGTSNVIKNAKVMLAVQNEM